MSTTPDEIKKTLIEALEDLRRQAEAGNLASFAYAGVGLDGATVITGLTNSGFCAVSLLGAVTVLSTRLSAAVANQMLHPDEPEEVTN